MGVLSVLVSALRGGSRHAVGSKDMSLAAALTSGLYEVSQAMSAPGGDVQHSLDLITSAAAAILRVERCVLLLPDPELDHLVIRSMAGIPRGRQFEKYRQEMYKLLVLPILTTGQGMIVSEGKPGTDRNLVRLMRRLEVKGFLAAPVKVPAGGMGMMGAATPMDGRELQDGDLKLLSVLANFAAIALENAALVAHLDKKARKLTAIFEISKALNEENDPGVLFQLIVDRATELMGASSGSVIRTDPDSETLFIEAERGLGPEVKKALRLKVGEGITGWVAKEGEPLLVPDVRTDPRYVQANPAVRSEMAVPVKWGSEVMGVINLDHHQAGGFTEEDLELLTAFGNAAAVAIRNANALCGWPRKADREE